MKTKYMGYEEYSYVSNLIKRDIRLLQDELEVALTFVKPKDMTSSVNIYEERVRAKTKAKEEFRKLVKDSYKKHPSADVRKFWGVEV